jgi:hypothetical protein
VTGRTCGQSDASDATFSIPLAPDLYFIPAGLEFCPGQQNVEIPVHGRNSAAIRGYGVNVCYDPDVLECVDLTVQGTRGQGALYFQKLCKPGCAQAGVIFSAACPPQIDAGEGIILKLVMNVKPGAPPGPTAIDILDVDPAYNTMAPCSGPAVNPVLQDGTLQICGGRRP